MTVTSSCVHVYCPFHAVLLTLRLFLGFCFLSHFGRKKIQPCFCLVCFFRCFLLHTVGFCWLLWFSNLLFVLWFRTCSLHFLLLLKKCWCITGDTAVLCKSTLHKLVKHNLLMLKQKTTTLSLSHTHTHTLSLSLSLSLTRVGGGALLWSLMKRKGWAEAKNCLLTRLTPFYQTKPVQMHSYKKSTQFHGL